MVAWDTNPVCDASAIPSCLLLRKASVPEEGRTSLAAIRKSVVLPEPLRPARTTHSPAAISSDTRRNAYSPPYRLSIFSKQIATGEIVGGVNEEPRR